MNITLEKIKEKKIELIKSVGKAETIRDFGGVWGVSGMYMFEGAKILGCSGAQMVDTLTTNEFQQKLAGCNIACGQLWADFREPIAYSTLTPYDVSLLYEVLLHQDTYVDVIKNVLSVTKKAVLVAQPTLKEDLFAFPCGAINLQFYSKEIKADLFPPSFAVPDKEPPTKFDTSKWMWGHSATHIESIFFGYGCKKSTIQKYPLSKYWDYTLMIFNKT